MRSKNYWFIGATVFILLVVITSILLFQYKRTSFDITDNVQNIEDSVEKEEAKEVHVTLPDGTTLPTTVSTQFKFTEPRLPENWVEYFERKDVEGAQKMVKEYTEALKARGMLHPLREPDPAIEEAKKMLAYSKAHREEMNREIERQKKIVFERRESIDRFMKETRERSARVNTWLEEVGEPKPADKPSSDIQLTDTNTDAWQNDLNTYIITLDADIVNKYPTAVLSRYFSDDEIEARFSTEDSKAFVQIQQQQMLTDMTQQINQYLSNDTNNRTEKINFIRKRLSEYWDTDIVEQISGQLE